MKALVFLLFLANLLFFAYTEGYFGHTDNPDAARVQQQLNAERIHIMGRGEPPAGKKEEAAPKEAAAKEAEKEAPKEAGKADKEQVKEPAKEPAKEAAKKDARQTCIAWGGLSAKEADRLSSLLGDKFGEFKLAKQTVPAEGGSWWVFIPPLPNKADAEKKASELRKLGVDDYFVVQDAGPNRFAISLGVFSNESGANERLTDLKDKGVRSAKVGARKGKDALHLIEARGAAGRESDMLEAVAKALPDSRSQSCK